MRIAITGASGYVGSAAARCAAERCHTLIRILRPGSRPHGPDDVAVDLQNTERLEEIASQVDAVIHCAASDNPAFLDVSEAASRALIDGLRAGGRFATHSGGLVFGDTGQDPIDAPAYAPPPSLAARAGFHQRLLCPPRPDVFTRIVYGSLIFGGYGAVVPSALIQASMKSGAVLYFGEGDQVWSSAHVVDFGALLVDAVENETPENACLFAAGRAVQLKPVADILGRVLGVPSRPVTSDREAECLAPFADALRLNQHFCSELARERFRWCPELSDNAETIVRALSRHASRATL